MTRRRAGVIASSPVLVGAITTLIVILAVFLAYNANNGLPFVPTYRLSAQVPNANTLVKGNDVRIGGVRVGIIEKIEPIQDPETGAVRAKVDMKLDKSARAGAQGLDRRRAVALGARPQVPGDHQGDLERGLRRGVDPAAQGRPRRSRSRSTSS